MNKNTSLLIVKILMWLAAIAAFASGITAMSDVHTASHATKMAYVWNCYGYFVFAALFALLALRPKNYRGLWEITIFNKLALTVTALLMMHDKTITGTSTIIGWDGGLSVVLIVAYILCKGWTA
ncbi:MAG: hypothetical protein ACQR33_06690 [Candidatus Saccharibacteria bacterium]